MWPAKETKMVQYSNSNSLPKSTKCSTRTNIPKPKCHVGVNQMLHQSQSNAPSGSTYSNLNAPSKPAVNKMLQLPKHSALQFYLIVEPQGMCKQPYSECIAIYASRRAGKPNGCAVVWSAPKVNKVTEWRLLRKMVVTSLLKAENATPRPLCMVLSYKSRIHARSTMMYEHLDARRPPFCQCHVAVMTGIQKI